MAFGYRDCSTKQEVSSLKRILQCHINSATTYHLNIITVTEKNKIKFFEYLL